MPCLQPKLREHIRREVRQIEGWSTMPRSVIRVELLPEVGEFGKHRLAALVGVALVVEHIHQGDPPMRAAFVWRVYRE